VAAARGFIELVEHFGDLNEQQVYYLSRALGAMDRMQNLIDTLLQFARLESGLALTLAPMDLNAMIHEVASFLEAGAAKRGITLDLPPQDQPVNIVADARLLDHVVSNLLNNALKYNVDDGLIEVRIDQREDEVQVDVRDTGVGIAPEEIPHVFERFYRANNQDETMRKSGSGLGLAISRAIVEMHGGRIWVVSELGQGSTFSFVLPRRDSPGSHIMKQEEHVEGFSSFFSSKNDDDAP
jgi:signal transduction histidine kinase